MGEESSSEEEIKAESASPFNPPSDSLAKRVRLARLQDRRERKALFITGNKAVSSLMVLYFQENALGKPRYAVYASKKLGSAVQRNRIKRVFREALYSKKRELKGYDFILVPRVGAKDLSVHEAIAHLGQMLVNNGILIG